MLFGVFVAIAIALTVAQDVVPTRGTYVAIVTVVLNLIDCVKMDKAYKSYKESGVFPGDFI